MLLLIDDDETFRRALADNLRDDGYKVMEYESPAQVPSLSGLDHIELAITDYMMDAEDGWSFAKRLHAERPEVPVVIATAYCTPHLEKLAAASGFVQVLRKPFAYEDLNGLLGRLRS